MQGLKTCRTFAVLCDGSSAGFFYLLKVGNGPNTVSESTVSNTMTELSEFFVTGRQKGGFVKGWFWRTYPRSGGTCERTLVPVFVPGEHANVPSFRFSFRVNIRQNHPFGKPPFCQPPNFGPHRVPGRELSEFLSAYYMCAKVSSVNFSQNSPSLLQNSVSSLFRNSGAREPPQF